MEMVRALLSGWTRPRDNNVCRMAIASGHKPHDDDLPIAFETHAGWLLVARSPRGAEHSVVRPSLEECCAFLASLSTQEPHHAFHADPPPASPADPAPAAPGDADPPPAAGGADPAGDRGDALVGVGAAGTLIDQRRNELSLAIDYRAADLKAPAVSAMQNTDIVTLTNAIMLNLASDDQRNQERAYYAAKSFVGQVDDFAKAMKDALASFTPAQLDAFDVAAAIWPVWGG